MTSCSPSVPRWSNNRSTTTHAAAATSRLGRLTIVLFLGGWVGQQRNDALALAFAPPSGVTNLPFFSVTAPRRVVVASRSVADRVATRARYSRQQQRHQRCCTSSIKHAASFGGLLLPIRTCSATAPLRAEAGGNEPKGEEPTRSEGEGKARKSGSDNGAARGEDDGGEGTEAGLGGLPDIVNPFKLAFEAGRNLRATLENTLEQITGTASPVGGCCERVGVFFGGHCTGVY